MNEIIFKFFGRELFNPVTVGEGEQLFQHLGMSEQWLRTRSQFELDLSNSLINSGDGLLNILPQETKSELMEGADFLISQFAR